MNCVTYSEFAERYMKALGENERQAVLNYLHGISDQRAQQLMDASMTFHKSSPVNGTWFWRTLLVLAGEMRDDVLDIWLWEGIGICRGSWECTLSFLKASPEMVKTVETETFLNWVKIGRALVRFSNNDAIWFFKHSEDIFTKLRSGEQSLVTYYVLQMLEYSWQTAVACLRSWVEIQRFNQEETAEDLLMIGLGLAKDLPDDAPAYFVALPAFLRNFGRHLVGSWVQTAYVFSNVPRGVVAAYFKTSPVLIGKVKAEEFESRFREWAEMGNILAQEDGEVAGAFFEVTLQFLKSQDWNALHDLVLLVGQVSREHTSQGALEFIKNLPEILQQLDIKEIAQWVNYGLNTIEEDKRLAYFSLKSQESRDAISRLRTGLYLETIKKVILLYCEGLTGETLIIRNASDLPGKIHQDDKLFSTLDTRRIYLPDVIKLFENDQENLRLYRAMLMHMAAYKEFGTLGLNKDDYKDLAANPKLGVVFEFIEGNRVDYLAMQKYHGLERDFRLLLSSTEQASRNNILTDDNSFITHLKNYLWPDSGHQDYSENDKINRLLSAYWQDVRETGGSARKSIHLAWKTLNELSSEEQDKIAHRPNNLIYRGILKYDLLYAAISVDEKITEDEGSEKPVKVEIEDDVHSHLADSSEIEFNPQSDFIIFLKKRLLEFYEDEVNPYRMIAYYDEWDRTLNDYKKDWCKVREIVLKPSSGRFVTKTLEENHGMINTLKRYFGMLRPDRFRRYGRQEDGEHIDIDAVVEAMVEIKAGVSSADGFYIRRDKRERDVAVGFLLDLSFSTEETVPGTGKTLLDVEKESVIVMAEALEVLGDKYAIYGFNSDRRDKVNFYVVKDFEEAYSEDVRQRYGGLQSNGMTRLAAAVRHAVFKLERVQAAIKILILLSDGRPFDFDYNSGLTKDHEEYYAETDTRMALREAKMHGVNPFCITVDCKGKDYLEYIFGNVSYIIIDDVNVLPTKLTETYKNLTT